MYTPFKRGVPIAQRGVKPVNIILKGVFGGKRIAIQVFANGQKMYQDPCCEKGGLGRKLLNRWFDSLIIAERVVRAII